MLSLGEAKWGEVLGARHVERLRRARDLLAARGWQTGGAVLALYSGAGFEPDLGAGDDPDLGADDDPALTVGPDGLFTDAT